MTKARASLTELEGAILSVIRMDPGSTAYRVRRVFEVSHSAEWSGSAGAVYPAIKRLEAEALIAAKPATDRRGTRSYRLTRAGEATHERWLCDIDRAAGPGLDPFRTRAGFWSVLPPPARRSMLKNLKHRIEQRREQLRQELPALDAGDVIMCNLHIALQDLRLRWIDEHLKKSAQASR
jgi:DNA-binding PadR family transcriptional regulator